MKLEQKCVDFKPICLKFETVEDWVNFADMIDDFDMNCNCKSEKSNDVLVTISNMITDSNIKW